MRRVLSAIPVALIAITACFFILRVAPGGPFDSDRALPPVTLANLRAHYNLDLPLIQQYFIYVSRLLQGDFGPSMVYNDFTVAEMIWIGLPFTTAWLAGNPAACDFHDAARCGAGRAGY